MNGLPTNSKSLLPGCLRLLLCAVLILAASCRKTGGGPGKPLHKQDVFTVVDMRGVEVTVPVKIRRVVSIDDGFTASVMAGLGEIDKMVGLGSTCIQRNFNYEFETISGTAYAYENGRNPVSVLHPFLQELPLVAASNAALNYERLAQLAPDVVILRAGSCTFGCLEEEKTIQALQRMASLGIPVVVLNSATCATSHTLESISEEIRLLGQLFGKAEQAGKLAQMLEENAREVQQQTAALAEKERPRVLLLGLSPKARSGGAAANTKGTDTMESHFIEAYAHARNAYEGPGGRSSALILSAEQILTLNPDVILLPTSSGYHPPRELYEAPYFQNLQSLKALQNRRVYALPWMPCNCAKRLEYPIELLITAKAAHPELFSTWKVHEWVLGFYKDLYGVDEPTAKKLRSAQWLDWMVEANF